MHAPSVSLDPITVEVVRNKLDGIANEMELTLLKSSFSPIVKEGLDASASLFTPDGTTISQACSIPIHLATLIPAVAAILAEYPVDTMQDGDTFILNDPYCGGTHLPDIAIVMPVLHQGRVIALSAAMTHHQDVGGMTPGSVPTNATEIFQEGIRIPPLKLRSAGVFDPQLVRMLKQNVRVPEMFMGDLNAQIAACTVGVRRLQELAKGNGHNQLAAIFAELIRRSEAMTRDALLKLPQGTFRYEDYLDNDGVELDKPVKIAVAATVKDGTIELDFHGSSPQTRGPFNCVRSGVQAASFFAVRALTDPTIPTNGGCFRPVILKLPERSVVNAAEPAAVNARTATIKRITGAVLGALAQAMPERAPAASAGELLVLAFGGRKDGNKPFVVGELIAGGSGGSRGKDGVDAIETDATNCMNLPAEAMEMEAPIRIRRIGLRADSGGPGARRGGLGVVREYEILADDIAFSHRGERHVHAAPGLAGGASGAKAVSVIKRADGSEEIILSKRETRLNRGDRLVLETAGGGGYGDPKARDAALVADDIANGKVSRAAATAVYGMKA